MPATGLMIHRQSSGQKIPSGTDPEVFIFDGCYLPGIPRSEKSARVNACAFRRPRALSPPRTGGGPEKAAV
ncbi:hypothetical protein A6M21_04905 [Desulfotomaculum copahuensis]|uniref:Uncharacterized protein n=1 Tax=Desulfotomaculum copahuensis TaxID=1838280 RepID=A0A1B7LHZ7_9FIRM|nr:hypothetical protein A6M21_04905 [Desulfotomaculum copahuensis]